MGIGQKLRALMGEQGEPGYVSVGDLAEHLGVDPRTVRNWRNKDQEPSLSTGLRIAAFFGVEPVDLIVDPLDDVPSVGERRGGRVRRTGKASAQRSSGGRGGRPK